MNPERIELIMCEVRDAIKKVGKKYKLDTYKLLTLSKTIIDGTIQTHHGKEHLEEIESIRGDAK
tara:strand:+ start:312 stop:503 length:192 start_codon:yes stop_codon:yes gene_type:complete